MHFKRTIFEFFAFYFALALFALFFYIFPLFFHLFCQLPVRMCHYSFTFLFRFHVSFYSLSDNSCTPSNLWFLKDDLDWNICCSCISLFICYFCLSSFWFLFHFCCDKIKDWIFFRLITFIFGIFYIIATCKCVCIKKKSDRKHSNKLKPIKNRFKNKQKAQNWNHRKNCQPAQALCKF